MAGAAYYSVVTVKPPAEEAIKVGYFGPMDYDFGKSGYRGLEIAVEEINEAGGILGRPLKIIGPVNTEMSCEEAVKIYRNLVWVEECDFILDGLSDDEEAAIMPTVAETDIITIGTWTTTIECYDKVWQDYDKYKNWFGTNLNDWGLAQNCLYVMKDIVIDELGAKKIVLLREDLIWTYGVRDFLYEECPKMGLEVVDDVVFPLDTMDFTPFYQNARFQVRTSFSCY